MYVEAKETMTGKHEPCVMITIGRRIKDDKEIDKEAIRVLPVSIQEKVLGKYTDETLRSGPPLTLRERIIEAMKDTVRKINHVFFKTLGLNIVNKDKDEEEEEDEAGQFEIYEYIKYRKPEDMLPMIYGDFMALGVLCNMGRLKQEEIFSMIKSLQLQAGKFTMLGYDRAKEKGWK
jgi:hypothetical protein